MADFMCDILQEGQRRFVELRGRFYLEEPGCGFDSLCKTLTISDDKATYMSEIEIACTVTGAIIEILNLYSPCQIWVGPEVRKFLSIPLIVYCKEQITGDINEQSPP